MVFGSILLIAIVPIVLIVIAYFISRAVFRIVMAVSTVLFVVALVIGGFVMYDAYRFTEALEEGPTRFVFENTSIGVETRNGTMYELNASGSENQTRVTFTISEPFISENASASFEGVNVSSESSLAVMAAPDPYAAFATALAESYARNEADEERLVPYYDERLREAYDDETEMRSYVFGQLLSATIDEYGSDALIHGIRSGEVLVEPERPILSFIKRMPGRVIESALDVEVR